jgi:peroxiredoxin
MTSVRRPLWIAVGGTTLLLLAAFVAVERMAGHPSQSLAAPSAAASQEKHYVTPRQLTASGAMANVTVTLATASDQDGKTVNWSELVSERPVVVVFIKDGCPCNVEFEPYFHGVARAYADVVRFVGVIDGDVAAAHQYSVANRVPYPIIADSSREIIKRFHAENGAYVALVAPGGIIDTLWPGCSVEVMRELNARVARLGHIDEKTVDFTGLPNAMTTGCPYSP